jgi:hypothetical protein
MGWKIEGQYFETCNCDFVCPCIGSNLTARPTEGDCKAAITMKIDKGEKDGVNLDGLTFIVLMHAPQAMIDGDITIGLIVDENANDEQTEAIASIATGGVGGPMAGFAPLVGKMAGIEKCSIQFENNGMSYSVKAGDFIDQALDAVMSPSVEGEPVYLDNTVHPVNKRLALATATHSKFHAFGIDWDDSSGTRNGHFAPFAWSA